jgi:hypothetical protein
MDLSRRINNNPATRWTAVSEHRSEPSPDGIHEGKASERCFGESAAGDSLEITNGTSAQIAGGISGLNGPITSAVTSGPGQAARAVQTGRDRPKPRCKTAIFAGIQHQLSN